jgi:hypothetical protein
MPYSVKILKSIVQKRDAAYNYRVLLVILRYNREKLEEKVSKYGTNGQFEKSIWSKSFI